MNLTIELSSSEEVRLCTAAKESGLAPAEFVKKLVEEHLPAVDAVDEHDLKANIRARDEQENANRTHIDPTLSLFALWADEDARLTETQRAENERIYAEIEKNGVRRIQI